jgi:hypothetical protein
VVRTLESLLLRRRLPCAKVGTETAARIDRVINSANNFFIQLTSATGTAMTVPRRSRFIGKNP